MGMTPAFDRADESTKESMGAERLRPSGESLHEKAADAERRSRPSGACACAAAASRLGGACAAGAAAASSGPASRMAATRWTEYKVDGTK